jgi:omega-6 fatty acid desaturase (delta-12 desaturase)
MQEQVYAHIAKYATSSNWRGGLEWAATLGAWTALFWAPWWTFPLHALVMTRLFIVGVHDAGHHSLFKNPALNDIVLQITSPLLCTPGRGWWRPMHNYHHEHSNDLAFNQNSQTAFPTVARFHRMKWWKRALYRYFTRPTVFLTQTAPLAMTIGQLVRLATPTEIFTQVAVFLILYPVWVRYLLIMSVASSFGVFLFHLQHTFPECVRMVGKDHFENGYSGSSFLQVPWWMKPFTGSIEYHHIHHLNARVPFYRLRACHDEAPPELWKGIRRITFQEGWEYLRLVMWSEQKNRLVTFDEVDAEKLLT